ncbi:hypothetical protein BH23GEM3_BH23GEM3_02050 [soil metagenome]|nr:hypothetical protein [Gemmatimonadota bacterium]
MFTTLLGLLLFAIVGLIVFTLVLALIGLAIGVVFGTLALLIKAIPFLLVGWLILKLVQRTSTCESIRATDRKWLDS